MRKRRSNTDDARGAARLAIEATTGVTSVVEAMHRTIARGPALLGYPLSGPVGAITAVAYQGVRGVTRWVGGGIDLSLRQLAPLLGTSIPGPEREALLAALNGTLGDHLVRTDNPLAIQMRLRRDGQPLELGPQALRRAFPRAGPRILVLIHGSSMSDLQWTRLGHNHGADLARDLGYTPIAVHYNSGLHVSTNGRMLSALLERLARGWPSNLQELAFLGHSMGGLVARSACEAGEQTLWRSKLKNLVCLGTPHHGSSLERVGSWIDLLLGIHPYSAPLARLGKIRSAGVTDLRFGYVRDRDWEGRDRFAHRGDSREPLPLPEGVACFAIAATTAPRARARLPGDGLVSVDSALGKHARPELTLGFPRTHQWIGLGMNHLDLLSSSAVYRRIRGWLGAPRD